MHSGGRCKPLNRCLWIYQAVRPAPRPKSIILGCAVERYVLFTFPLRFYVHYTTFCSTTRMSLPYSVSLTRHVSFGAPRCQSNWKLSSLPLVNSNFLHFRLASPMYS
ncbi:hypothetical protein BDW72DRAFT_103163 [Aspergillus terricola var. indicus]